MVASSSTSPEATANHDIENQKSPATPNAKVRHWHLVTSHSLLTEQVRNHEYKGSGTEEDPFVVEFIPNDPRDPMNFPQWKKWFIVLDVAVATLAVAFVSTAYTGAVLQIIKEFHVSTEIAILGVSLFVLGFALGPLIWAPLSELYGRQILFIITYIVVTAMSAGAAAVKSMAGLIVLRFLAGTFGASVLTNSGGVIADLLPASQRGLGMALFACAPFLGPVIGPIVGGFMGETVGWRWVEGVMSIFTGVLLIFGALTIPETYAPTILARRAANMSKKTGLKYISIMEKRQGKLTAKAAFSKALLRPWIFLFLEPIVLLLTIYSAIIYGTLYMLFSAFPIVFEQHRGWSQGVGGLSFCGVAVGLISGLAYSFYDNRRYLRIQNATNGEAPPEARLPPAILASFCVPIGILWFAWTNYISIHWIVCIIGTAIFGFGIVLLFLPIMNYLIDSYTIYAASVLASNAILRSLFGAIFPLFTTYMYQNLGIHWASSVPGFLALACLPFPWLFWKYGHIIRMKCKYSAQAADMMRHLRESQKPHAVQNQGKEEREEQGRGEDEDDDDEPGTEVDCQMETKGEEQVIAQETKDEPHQ